jgi:ABC-type polar amino acid transport system ATPase subunit
MAVHGRPDFAVEREIYKTSIVVTHDTHLARKLADTIVFLQEGEPASSSQVEFERSRSLSTLLMQDK